MRYRIHDLFKIPILGILFSFSNPETNPQENLTSLVATDEEEIKRKEEAKRLEMRVSQLETDVQKIRTETAYGNFGARTAPANPQIDGYGFFATADFLWWKLEEGGTEYLLKTKSHFPLRGSVKHFHFDGMPGFKLGAGYIFEHDSWDANLEYTYFKTEARASFSSPSLFPLVGNQPIGVAQSKAHWNVGLQNLDLLLGRNYFISKFLSLKPFFGLAFTWIDQQRHFRFKTLQAEHVALKSKNDFWGVGPTLGVNSQFFFTEHWSAYGNFSGDLLWGTFAIREWEKNKTAHTEFYNLHYHLRRVVPTIAFGIGGAYEISFSQDRYHLMIKAGYENHYWWRQNQLPLFNSPAPIFQRISEDLGVQGLTMEFRLDF